LPPSITGRGGGQSAPFAAHQGKRSLSINIHFSSPSGFRVAQSCFAKHFCGLSACATKRDVN
jgi:hypothetical protein